MFDGVTEGRTSTGPQPIRNQLAVRRPTGTRRVPGGGSWRLVAPRRPPLQALSLDVFDTVLTRACGPPQALFLLLGKRLHHDGIIACSPEVFARVRAQAEADVWKREGGLDATVTLPDFYREVIARLHLDASVIDRLVTAEVRLEAELLRPTPQARELIGRWSARGDPLVFVSDTYVDRCFIIEQLRSHELWVEGAELFASTEHPASKDGGGLFDIVLEHLGVAPERLLHIGDNPRSDIAMAEARGIRTHHFTDGRLNRFEELLAERRWATGGLAAAFAGASRLARLDTPVHSLQQAAIRDVGAGVAAPLLVGYVLWILRRARRHGLQRLYFIARDGQVMAEIARRLIQRLGLTIEVCYLHASRDSVNLAATFGLGEDEVAWITRDLRHLTNAQVLARFDITPDEIASLLEAEGIQPAEVAQRRLLTLVREHPKLRKLALERAAQRRELVIDYLRQERATDGRNGLVDFGGVGSQMRALHTVLTEAGAERPKMFLVGLDDPVQAGLDPPVGTPPWLEDTECYLYDHRRVQGVLRDRGFGTCVQMFCAADHGTVTGYERRDGMVSAVLSETRDDELITWGLPTLRAAITAFTEHLLLDPVCIDLDADVREPGTAVTDLFWHDPTVAEAKAWGAFPFEGAQAAGTSRQHLAHRYGWSGVLRGLRDRTFPNLGWMHWYEGSLRLSSPAVREPLRGLEHAYRRLERSPNPWARVAVATLRRLVGRSDRHASTAARTRPRIPYRGRRL